MEWPAPLFLSMHIEFIRSMGVPRIQLAKPQPETCGMAIAAAMPPALRIVPDDAVLKIVVG